MPKHAEIEGLRPFLVGAMREARHVLGSSASDDAAKARALRMLNDALGRLDRVRDARGDDEAICAALRAKDATHRGSPKCLNVAADWLESDEGRAYVASKRGGCTCTPDALLAMASHFGGGHAPGCAAARSPQGEDHEARIKELEALVEVYEEHFGPSPSRDGTVALDPPLSEREREAIEAMRAAVKIVGDGEEPVPYDIRGMAAEVVRLRAEVERLSARDGTVAVEDAGESDEGGNQ